MAAILDEAQFNSAIDLLKRKPTSIAKLAKRYHRTPRSIRRWLELMEERGHYVIREGVKPNSPYRIVE